MEAIKKNEKVKNAAIIGGIALIFEYLYSRTIGSSLAYLFNSETPLFLWLSYVGIISFIVMMITEMIWVIAIKKAIALSGAVPSGAIISTAIRVAIIRMAIACFTRFVLPIPYIISLVIDFGVYFIGATVLGNRKAVAAIDIKEKEDKVVEFYQRCIAAGLTDLETPEGLARLTLCAQNNKPPLEEAAARALYLQGKEETERRIREEEAAKRAAEFKEIDDKEAALEAATKQYADCFGQEKIAKMCKVKAAEYRALVAECDKKQRTIERGMELNRLEANRQEQSWAIHGGIASGIAGPAAGMATAMDIQQKNAVTRAANETYIQGYNMLAGNAFLNISDARANAKSNMEYWEKKAEEAKLLLMQELPTEELFSRLKPELIKQVQSKTGAVELSIKTQPTPNLYIFDHITAVVDGCIKAVLLDGEKRVGEAIFPLPVYGATTECEIESICRSPELKSEQTYQVVFEPARLWAIETKEKVEDPTKEEK